MFQIGQGLCQNVNENCAYDTVYACLLKMENKGQ